MHSASQYEDAGGNIQLLKNRTVVFLNFTTSSEKKTKTEWLNQRTKLPQMGLNAREHRYSACLDELFTSPINLSSSINISTFGLPASHLHRVRQKHTTILRLPATQRPDKKTNRDGHALQKIILQFLETLAHKNKLFLPYGYDKAPLRRGHM